MPKTRVYAVRLRFNSRITDVPEFKLKLGSVLRYWQSMTGDRIADLTISEVKHAPLANDPE